MSTVVYYTGPRRIDLGLRTNQYFKSRDAIAKNDLIKKEMDANSAFANFFVDEAIFVKRPPPGSDLFRKAKVAQVPPTGRTLPRQQLRLYRPRATH